MGEIDITIRGGQGRPFQKVTEASGQRAHGHEQESSTYTHTHTHTHTHIHTPSFELARLGLPFCKPKCFN